MYSKYIGIHSHLFRVCVVCIMLDHMKCCVTQRIYHMKISCIPLVRCVKFRIIDQCNCTVIHEIPCNRICQKKTGSTVRFPLDCLLEWCADVFLIPMLTKVKGPIHDPLNWTQRADAIVSCSLMLHDAQTRVNNRPSALMNDL